MISVKVNLCEILVIVVLQLRINGQLETHPGSQSEVVCDIHLVLQIERKLLVLHVRQELGTVPGVGISDTESSRSSVVHKIIPRGIDIITARSEERRVGKEC